jgi:hypothetical protein
MEFCRIETSSMIIVNHQCSYFLPNLKRYPPLPDHTPFPPPPGVFPFPQTREPASKHFPTSPNPSRTFLEALPSIFENCADKNGRPYIQPAAIRYGVPYPIRRILGWLQDPPVRPRVQVQQAARAPSHRA